MEAVRFTSELKSESKAEILGYMARSRRVLAAFLMAFAVLQPGAPAAQQYDAREDILRAKIRAIGAGFVGNVKSTTADTVTVTSDGSYSVIRKGEERTFQITPNTTVSQMTEDGEFKQPQALQANELRAAAFVGVVEDTQNFRSDRHIALRIYTLPLSMVVGNPTGSAPAVLEPPPAPSEMSPAMQKLYREGYADWRRREQVYGSEFVGLVQSVAANSVTVVSDIDSSLWLKKGTQYTFHLTPDTKVESDAGAHGKDLREGQPVTVRYRDMGDTHLALGIRIRRTGFVVGGPSLPGQPSTSGQPSVPERDRSGLATPSPDPSVSSQPSHIAPPNTSAGKSRPQSLEAERLLNEARQYISHGQMELALTKMNQAIAADPTYADAYSDRGAYYGSQKDYDKALEDFEKEIMYSPSDAGAYNNVARTYALKGDFPQALIAEDYSLQRHANDPESYMVRGMIFLHFGKAHDAEEDFKYGEVLRGGTMASYAGQIQGMRSQPASPYRPELAGKTLNDAALQELHEQDRPAVDILDLLIAQEPKNADAWLLRGEAYYNLKQFALSREDIQQALRIAPNNAEAHRLLGRTMEAWPGAGDDAIREYNKAIELDPQLAMAYINRASWTFQHHPNLQATALRDLDTALKVDPHNPYAWYNRAGYFPADLTNSRVDWDFQIYHYGKAIECKPDFAGAYGARGVAELGKYYETRDQALKRQGESDIRKALQIKPELQATLQAMVDDLESVPAANAYLKQMIAELFTPAPRARSSRSSTSSSSSPCGAGGGEAAACRARDYAAQQRYAGGVATQTDKSTYGDYK